MRPNSVQPPATAPPVLQVRYSLHAVAAPERQAVGRRVMILAILLLLSASEPTCQPGAGSSSSASENVGGWVVFRDVDPAYLVTIFQTKEETTFILVRNDRQLDRLVLPNVPAGAELLWGFDCSKNGTIDADSFGIGPEYSGSAEQPLFRAWRVDRTTERFVEVAPATVECSSEYRQDP